MAMRINQISRQKNKNAAHSRASLAPPYLATPRLTLSWGAVAHIASHCVLLDPIKDACTIDHGVVRADYPQNRVTVAVEFARMEQSGFPAVESPGGQFVAADPIDVDHVPLFFHSALPAFPQS
jgi:hypothetical protein